MITRKQMGWWHRRALFAVALAAVACVYAADPDDDDDDRPPGGVISPRSIAPAATPGAPGAQARPPAPPAPPASGTSPQGAPVTRVNNNEVLLNFQAADIQAVVKAISQMTNRNFLLDPRVKGQITIISAKPVPRASAYQIFLSALKAQGFTAVEGPGGLVKIIPVAEAKQSADVFKDTPRGGEQLVTHVIVLQNVSPTQMVPILRPLMAPTSQLSAYEAANALILTDYADNVRRMLAILERIDQPITSDVTVVALKFASALDLADLITRLSAPGAGGIPGIPIQQPGATVAGDRFTIIPDLRTNSLLIRTENPGRLGQLQSLIVRLDVPATTAGQTRVIYLRNAEAVKLAEVLRGLLAGEARAQQATAAPVVGAQRPVGARSGAEASLVQADEATNALIINASDAVYNNLRAVIEKLDVRRAQVFVEALIAEITADNTLALGFQFAAAGGSGSTGVAGVTNLPTANSPGIIPTIATSGSTLAASSGLTLAFLGKEITLPDGRKVRGIGALARALESSNMANILSTPNLMTLDNAEAKIIVGQNVPFITGSFASAAGATGANVNPFQTIERKDVGIQLRIKPQISEGGGIKLDIFQEISTVTPAPAGVTASDIITNKRSVETKVLVDDGATIVLGGLIQDRTTEVRSQVPILGSIPLIGALFRSKDDRKEKTNLMIFLRPVIVRTVDDGYRVATDRYDYIRAQNKDRPLEQVQILDRLQPAVPKPKAAEPPKEKENTVTPVPPTEQRNPG